MAAIKMKLSEISELSMNLDFDDEYDPVYSKRKSLTSEISAGDESNEESSFRSRNKLDLRVLQR
jgi:hypothetical protein